MASDKKKDNKPASKTDIARAISQTLLKRRQEKKISIEEVSAHLKIRAAFVQALEKGEWDELPGGVYLKSFLKKYAVYLGIDADSLVDPYFQEVKKEIREKEIEEREEEDSTAQSDNATRAWWISASVGAILLLGFVKFITNDSQPSSPADAIQRPPVQAPAPEPIDVASAPQPASHDISVFTTTPLWVRIDAENRTFEGFIPISSTWAWTGAGTFQIRLGHTKEVTLLFDGENIPLGENQKRVTLPYEN